MNEAKFNIGDRVKDASGRTGEVMDAVYSRYWNAWSYEICDDETEAIETFKEDSLELAPSKEFSMDIKIDIANNVVIATMYETVGDVQRPIHKGHGHLIHEGEIGIAQAASYACMRLYKSMGGYER